MAGSGNKKILASLKNDLKAAQKKISSSYTGIQVIARKIGNGMIDRKSEAGKKSLTALFKKLNLTIQKAEVVIKKDYERRIEIFNKKIKNIERLKSTVSANNHLLEVKRKELLLKASEIETAYEEISERNHQLVQQKEEIDSQTEMLRLANQDILEKNQELETRAEALLDQADYLHDANETISHMHMELARQKDEILQKNEELQSLNEEKNNLIGIVAHDLKSPLNQIKGLVSVIKMTTKLDEDAANCLTMIETSVVRLNSMIGKILDTEAIESKQLNLNIEPVDLCDVFTNLTNRFQLDASGKKITLHMKADPGVYISVDRNYLTQILENLLSNAIKFSPEDKNIFFNLHDNNDHIVAEVCDEGPGLTEEDKKKLFSKYQKLSARPTGNESSTGLGLSIVKKFTESMGGQIWCESEAGNGARFFVKFMKS